MRRTLPTRRGLLGAGAAVLATPALARTGARRLTLVATWPRGLPGLGDGPERFAARVAAMSAGTLEVEVFAAGERVGAFESFGAVRSGAADLYHGAEYYWEGTDPAFNFFTAVPFGFTAREFTGWVREGGGQALWDELSASHGLKALMCGNTGVQMGGWYDRPIRGLEDMKGLKIRIPGVAAEIFRQLGSEPVSLPGGAIPEALLNGDINAVEWVGPFNDLDFGVQKVLTHYMYPGFHEPGTCASLGVNLALWTQLGETERAIISAAAAAENREMPAQYAARSGRALVQLQAEYGTSVMRFPDTLYAEVARLSEQVVRDIGAQSGFAGRVVESFLDYRARVAPSAAEILGASVIARQSALARGADPTQEVVD